MWLMSIPFWISIFAKSRFADLIATRSAVHPVNVKAPMLAPLPTRKAPIWAHPPFADACSAVQPWSFAMFGFAPFEMRQRTCSSRRIAAAL
jgi:hypothetical protein